MEKKQKIVGKESMVTMKVSLLLVDRHEPNDSSRIINMLVTHIYVNFVIKYYI